MENWEDEKPKKEEKSQLKNWAIFSGIAFQMGATIFVCAWIGKKLDARFPSNKNWFTIGLVLFGIFASIFVLLKQLKNINK